LKGRRRARPAGINRASTSCGGLREDDAVPTLCLEPGCAELAVRRGRCRRHLRELLLERGRRSDRDGWSWSRTRGRVLRVTPVCCRCGRARSSVVHHVVAVAAGGGDELENLEGWCSSYHRREHLEG
jgi:hypothetical protein